MSSFSDTKSPSLIHLHHPTHLAQRRQIKLSLGDESRLSSPPRPRDVQNVNFHSQVPLNISDGDSNRIFIDRTSFVGESHIWMFKTDVYCRCDVSILCQFLYTRGFRQGY
jgi:hypothetical protein